MPIAVIRKYAGEPGVVPMTISEACMARLCIGVGPGLWLAVRNLRAQFRRRRLENVAL